MDQMSIPECYRGRNVFLTGFTGLIGKALVEKLLRSCPDIGNIYVLLRSKKGKSIHERLRTILGVPLFDLLRKENPDALKKVIPVAGDVQELDLGLNEEDKNTIIKNINIVFHGAASIRFDDPLVYAIITNTRGTREIVNLALKMNNILAFIHVSTTYCLVGEKTVIEEKLYPAPLHWKDAIILSENYPNLNAITAMTEKYIHPFPNTYTLTKILGEHVVNDLCKNRIPAVIIRPSIVNSTWTDPIEGWADNLNGFSAIILGVHTGMLREICSNPDVRPNSVPLDFVTRAFILAGFKRIWDANLENVHIYNCCSDTVHQMALRDLPGLSREMKWTHPMRIMVWYPQFFYNPYPSLFPYTSFFTNTIPAIMVDILLLLSGNKTRALKLSRKGYIAMLSLKSFSNTTWIFKNDKTLELENLIQEAEVGKFSLKNYLNWSREEIREYIARGAMLGAHYMLNIKYDKEQGLRLTRIMWVLDRIVKIIVLGIVCYIFCSQIYKYYCKY